MTLTNLYSKMLFSCFLCMLFLDKMANVTERKQFKLRRGAIQEYLHKLGTPPKQPSICQLGFPISGSLQR